jgi:hypothetical protein
MASQAIHQQAYRKNIGSIFLEDTAKSQVYAWLSERAPCGRDISDTNTERELTLDSGSTDTESVGRGDKYSSVIIPKSGKYVVLHGDDDIAAHACVSARFPISMPNTDSRSQGSEFLCCKQSCEYSTSD